MLQQQQMPVRLKHSGHLIQSSLGLLKDAQTECIHQAVEAGLWEWQLRDIACSINGTVKMDAGNQWWQSWLLHGQSLQMLMIAGQSLFRVCLTMVSRLFTAGATCLLKTLGMHGIKARFRG